MRVGWFLFAVLSFPTTALAQDPVRALVVGPDNAPCRLVRAELSALGYEVVRHLALENTQVEGAMVAEDAAGAVVWVASPRGFDVRNSQGVVRNIVAGEQDAMAEHALALRAAELLRAQMLVEPSANRDVHPDPALAPAAIIPTSTAREWTLALGLSGWMSVPDLGPGASLAASIDWRPFRFFSAAIDLRLPLHSVTASAPEGRSLQWFGELILLLRVPWLPASNSFQFWTGVGFGGGLFISEGIPEAGWRGQKSSALAALVQFEVGTRWSVGERLRLGVNVRSGVSIPTIDIRYAERPVARFGLPLLELTAVVGLAI